jgi:hypothetical protein
MKGIACITMLELLCGMTKLRRLVQVRDGQGGWKERPSIASEARLDGEG